MSTKKVGARKGKEHQQLVLAGEQRVEEQLAAGALQHRHREGQLDVPVHRLAHDVGRLVAVERRGQHLDLQAGPRARRPRELGTQRVHHVLQVAPQVLERQAETEVAHDARERCPQSCAALARIVAAVGRLLAFEVLGGDGGAPEDELVAVVAPVQHLAGDRVEERLGELRLAMFVQQRDVGELDCRPERLVGFDLRKARQHRLHAFLHAPVVHRDARARELAHRRPVGALEQALRLARRLAEQAVMAVETGQDRPRDLGSAIGARFVDRQDLGRFAFHAPLRRPFSPAAAGRRTARPRSSRAGRWSRPCRRRSPA
jgi:hypothetical protein